MKTKQVIVVSMWICAALMIVGTYTAALTWEQCGIRLIHASTVSRPLGVMSTGVTVTDSDPPSYASISKAVPGITGPAPLPSEEQGLPGDS